MTGKTHDLAAASVLLGVVLCEPVRSLTLSTVLAAVIANQIGGIVPDIDQPTAPLWKNLPVGHVFGKVVDSLLGGHRFISHSIVGLGLFGLIFHYGLLWLQPILGHANAGFIWWAFMIGMLSHLLADTLTKEGVPWLLPFPHKFGFPPLKEFRITTGAWSESFVVFPLLILVDWLLALRNYDRLLLILHAIHR